MVRSRRPRRSWPGSCCSIARISTRRSRGRAAARSRGRVLARVSPDGGRSALEQTVREEAGLVLAALVASCGDLDLAEESFQDSVEIALARWPRAGGPHAPAPRLTT